MTKGTHMLRLFAIIALALSIALSGSTASAQTAAQLDDISEAVLAANTDDLVAALEVEPTDANLPSGFTVPADGVAENADLIDAYSDLLGDLGDDIVTVVHGIDTDPAVVQGTLSAAAISYLVFDHEITDDDLVAVGDVLESKIPPDPTTGIPPDSVDEIELFDSNAVVATLQFEQSENSATPVATPQVSLSDNFATVQIMAIPAGNVLVVSTIIVENSIVTEPQDLMPLTENLTIASVMYLGDVVNEL